VYELYYKPGQTQQSESEKSAELDARLAKLESIVGVAQADRGEFSGRSLVEQLESLEERLKLLTPGQIEIVKKRLKAILPDLDKALEQKKTPTTGVEKKVR